MNDANVRSYLLDELGDPGAPAGSRLWALYVSNEIRKTYYDKRQSGARLHDLVGMFAEHQAWQELGFLTWEDFCVKKLQAQADEVEREATARVVDIAENAKPQREPGRPIGTTLERINNSYNRNNNNKKVKARGNSAEYQASVIARDRPDILERMKAGEYKSVRSAAIDAGIIDPDKTKRYSLPTDPEAAARYLRTRVDAGWLATFVAELIQ